MRAHRWLGLLACSMPLIGCAVSGAEDTSATVITRVADSRIPYPTALIDGRLSLREGCLMINGGVAFWPAGTTWDGDKRQVLFGGDFQGAASAPIDSHFTGGGGTWNEKDNFSGVLDQGAEAAIRDCLTRTGATDAILVYPDHP